MMLMAAANTTVIQCVSGMLYVMRVSVWQLLAVECLLAVNSSVFLIVWLYCIIAT